MYLNENMLPHALPLYEVKELTMEEAMLVIAAEKEVVRDSFADQSEPFWSGASVQPEPAAG
jgi:hypothetical protein